MLFHIQINLLFPVTIATVFTSISCHLSWEKDRDGSSDLRMEDTYIFDIFSDDGCPEGLTLCNHSCVNLNYNHENCGSCNRKCDSVEVCGNGMCLIECPPNSIQCFRGCVNIQTDIYHCGECGHICEAGLHASPACDNGLCKTVCDDGWLDLDHDGSCESNCEPNAVEMCNGLDDNCNGYCDESFMCCSGDMELCTTSCGSEGTKECNNLCRWSSCIPPTEICNGSDDDCDTICENGYECCRGETITCVTSCNTTGTKTCNNLCHWNGCTPPDETCNGTDDDCNGAPDDLTGCRVAIYRFWCDFPASDHYYKLDSEPPSGCVYEQVAWYNYASAVSGRSFSTFPFYSLFISNGNYIDHLYTISEEEKNQALSEGAILEGIVGYCSPDPVPGMTSPVYKLWKGSISDHFYTINEIEKDSAISTYGYVLEGIACHAWNEP